MAMNQYGGYDDVPFGAEFYDPNPIYSSRADVDFYLHLARSAKGRILELGCGTGRILIPTAAAGCEIVGLDFSKAMLAGCREKLRKQPKGVRRRVRLVRGNMASFDLKEVFALITTPFRSFQHLLSVEDQLSCLRCANRHLKKGGRLVLDVFHVNPRMTYEPRFLLETEDVAEVELPDGRKVRRCGRIVSYHRAEQYNDIELIHYVKHPDGREERLVQALPLRYFFRYEVEHLLARCGFRVLELFGNYDKSPLTNDSPEMVFLAEKCQNTR
jgi:SAM-dependent methyltransferase